MPIIALSAGHNPNTGARAHDGTDEWNWNTMLADKLAAELIHRGYQVLRLHRKAHLGYTRAMRDLGQQMREGGADLALELHFNSASLSAHGCEFLHWWGSGKSRLLAQALGRNLTHNFPQLKARGNDSGARALWFHKFNEHKAYSGRGGAYCYLTPCPAVICEPGFASNQGDWALLKYSITRVATAYADGIDDYFPAEKLK